ncbi:MAG: ATP-grasp domain-containing protein [Clostridia bacterium]|nr:ATP-grasp domain-containing protein [Clostridia bacterium]
MKEVRILFTGVGRRVELVQAFRQAAFCIGINLKIFGTDITKTAPALSHCDYFHVVCNMKDKEYIPQLADICEKDRIDLIVPTIDTDLQILSESIDAFKHTRVLISSPDKIAVCRDKNKTAAFFEACGCKAPKTVNDWTLYDGSFPCFIKPKDGSSSINAFKAESREELSVYAHQMSDYVIQPFIDGVEYTVDAFCDFEGNPIYIIPRVRLKVRAGEVLKTQIDLDKKIVEESRRIIKEFKPVGPITIQLIRQKNTGEDYFIEINPRYGGGAPLSMKAGARSAEALLKLLLGEKMDNDVVIGDGSVFSRFDQSVCIAEGAVRQPVKGVIFDLDDTLYNEKQYVASGFKAVADFLGVADGDRNLWAYFEQNKPPIDSLLADLGCEDKKSECINVYRDHKPTISLVDGAETLLAQLKNDGIKIGIITDGRPDGQKEKISALNLVPAVDDIIITDELGGEQFRKPCDIAFRIMQRKWAIPFEQIIYIGDNINKDFHAPKQLGMKWLLVRNAEGLYYSEEECSANVVSSITDVYDYIKGCADGVEE